MSAVETPNTPEHNNNGQTVPASPLSPPPEHLNQNIPQPILHRRNRTQSQSEKAASGDHGRGIVEYFCRQRGHGFILPEDGSEHIFVHIYDIEGELVPHKGDKVEYRIMKVPPKCEKLQAVHVKIVNFASGRHETWSQKPVIMDIPEDSAM